MPVGAVILVSRSRAATTDRGHWLAGGSRSRRPNRSTTPRRCRSGRRPPARAVSSVSLTPSVDSARRFRTDFVFRLRECGRTAGRRPAALHAGATRLSPATAGAAAAESAATGRSRRRGREARSRSVRPDPSPGAQPPHPPEPRPHARRDVPPRRRGRPSGGAKPAAAVDPHQARPARATRRPNARPGRRSAGSSVLFPRPARQARAMKPFT